MDLKIKKECQAKRNFHGSLWCDDHTDLWIGTCKELQKGPIVSQNHPNPVQFEGRADCCEFLYFVCWSNDRGKNGFLAEITGSNTVFTGSKQANWEVFPTGLDFDSNNPRPSKELVEQQLKRASCEDWKPVTIGEQNIQNPRVFMPHIPSISANAHQIWYDSGVDSGAKYPSSPYVPFRGANHQEFLIFRLPVKDLYIEECINCPCAKCNCDCGCGCDGCNKNATEQDLELVYRALDKSRSQASKRGCAKPFNEKCEKTALLKNVNLEPCFHLHWGDGPTDTIEEHDTEVLYLTICNSFKDIAYKGLRVTKITLNPNIHSIDKIQIVPDRFICYDCLDPCSCKTREFALITRANNIAGNYTLEVEYCFDEIVLKSGDTSGKVRFPINITED